jgi:hypothetical protein
MQRDPLVLAQPCGDVVVLVGGVVVDDDVQLPTRIGLRDLLEECEELFVAVPRVAGVGHFPGRDLQRGEQRGGAVPNVVVGLLLRDPRPNGQDRRGPVQRLDLALLIDAQHDRRLGWVEVEPDDVADLGL